MLKSLGLAFALTIAAGATAFAQSDTCGDEPIPPAVPSAAEVGLKPPADAVGEKHQAFEDIKAWQAALKGYRDCLDSTVDTTKRQQQEAVASSKPDQERIKSLQAKIDAANDAYQRSTDTEERVVNDFHALSTAVCARSDVDRATCPK